MFDILAELKPIERDIILDRVLSNKPNSIIRLMEKYRLTTAAKLYSVEQNLLRKLKGLPANGQTKVTLEIEGIIIRSPRTTIYQTYLGDLYGNHFTIKIRELNDGKEQINRKVENSRWDLLCHIHYRTSEVVSYPQLLPI